MTPDSQVERPEPRSSTRRRPTETEPKAAPGHANGSSGQLNGSSGRAPRSSGAGEGDPDALRRGVRLLGLAALSGVLLVVVRLALVQSFVIPTPSMEPTLQAGDRVLVSRIGGVHRGDVIVFDGDGVFDPAQPVPSSGLARLGRAVAAGLGAPGGERDYAKRGIGLPGDHVVCCEAGGRLTVNGTALNETYLPPGTAPSTTRFDVVVPAGRLWVMGDNRSDSADSRAHLGDPGGGTVPLDHVVGRVMTVWWPFDRVTGVGSVDATRPTTTG